MNTVTTVDDDLMFRGRILRREWKRGKPHLVKSTSLPALELVPAHRPMFTCHHCGFSNVYIPLCLWCKWTSPEASVAFEAAASRRRGRSISGPSRAIWIVDLPRVTREKRPPLPQAGFASMGLSCGANSLLDSAAAVVPHPHCDRDSIIRATARSATNGLDTDLPPKHPALRIRRGLPATNVVVPSVPSRHPSTTPAAIIPSPSLNVTPMSGQLKHTPTHTVSLPPIVSPARTLRRKHHMTFPRPKSTRSLRSWTPAVSPPQHTVTSVARLGHPSRPYYTAIRPHLNDWGISLRPNTPATISAPPTSPDKRQALPSPPPGRPSFEFTRPRSSTTSGWSLSGEMELQIELSQRREWEEVGTVGKRASIVRGVRKLGMGLRDLVLRRG